VRDGRFQGNNSHENFVRLAVARNSSEFVDGVIHSHRTLRDDGPAFRHFREDSSQGASGFIYIFFVIDFIGLRGGWLGGGYRQLRIHIHIPRPEDDSWQRRWWRWEWLGLWLNDESVGCRDAGVQDIRLRYAEDQLCGVPVLPRALRDVYPIVQGDRSGWLPILRVCIQVVKWTPFGIVNA